MNLFFAYLKRFPDYLAIKKGAQGALFCVENTAQLKLFAVFRNAL